MNAALIYIYLKKNHKRFCANSKSNHQQRPGWFWHSDQPQQIRHENALHHNAPTMRFSPKSTCHQHKSTGRYAWPRIPDLHDCWETSDPYVIRRKALDSNLTSDQRYDGDPSVHLFHLPSTGIRTDLHANPVLVDKLLKSRAYLNG